MYISIPALLSASLLTPLATAWPVVAAKQPLTNILSKSIQLSDTIEKRTASAHGTVTHEKHTKDSPYDPEKRDMQLGAGNQHCDSHCQKQNDPGGNPGNSAGSHGVIGGPNPGDQHSSSSSRHHGHSHTRSGIIAAYVIGGILAITVAIFLLVWLYKRWRSRRGR